MVGGNIDHTHRVTVDKIVCSSYRPSRRNYLIIPYDAGLSAAAETLVRILNGVIVSPAVYPRFLEIAELARSLCHS